MTLNMAVGHANQRVKKTPFKNGIRRRTVAINPNLAALVTRT
jgi:hypothetical protein